MVQASGFPSGLVSVYVRGGGTVKYRGIEIRQEVRYISPTSQGVYWVACIDQRVLRSLTQNGIKAQIGRVLNGLPPADCAVCKHCVRATPINAAHCDRYGRECNPGVNFECEGFQVRP